MVNTLKHIETLQRTRKKTLLEICIFVLTKIILKFNETSVIEYVFDLIPVKGFEMELIWRPGFKFSLFLNLYCWLRKKGFLGNGWI